MKKLDLYKQVMMEAPADPPPDLPEDTTPDDPPDLPEDDMGDFAPDAGMDMMGGDPGGFGMDPNDPNQMQQGQEMELDEKISTIMNMNLYQKFLTLLNNIGNQLNVIKSNSDVLYTLSSESLEIVGSLKKLDENIHLYLSNYFQLENYSKNLLFYHKCLNLLKLLNDIFEKEIKKGIRAM